MQINENVTLTIKPGVIIKLLGKEAGFFVFGNFLAKGTAQEPIVFTSAHDLDYTPNSDQNPAPSDWLGIFNLNQNTNLTLDYTVIKYAGQAKEPPQMVKTPQSILKQNQALAQENNEEEENNLIYTGALHIYAGSVSVSHTIISHNLVGLAIDQNAQDIINLSIHNNDIKDNKLAGAVNFNTTTYPQINLNGNYWGNPTGPYHPTANPIGQGNPVSDHIQFIPFLTQSALTPPPATPGPVLLVPGIMGSYLYNQAGEEVWPAVSQTILDPWDLHLNKLALPTDGKPTGNYLMRTSDIIRKILINDYFQGLINELEDNGYTEGENLFVFPYDWRLNIDWLAGSSTPEGVDNLKDTIMAVKQQTGADKIDIIAHSLGGLVVKRYLQLFGTTSIDQFIDIATPHLGAPKAFKILMYGDNLNFEILKIFNLNEKRVFEISQNMPAVYQLLPSSSYFNSSDPDYLAFIADIYDYDQNNIKGNLNYAQSIEFMAATGRNTYLLNQAKDFHNELDSYYPQDNSVKTYNLVACGQATIGEIYILNKEKTGQYEYGLKYISGDATVPLCSAEALKTPLAYIHHVDHAYLPSTDGVKELVLAVLTGQENNFDFSAYPNLTATKQNCALNGIQVSLHSPINLHIYDQNHNHLGLKDNGDPENQIPGAQFDIIDSNQFAFLPFTNNTNYLITDQATATGTFNARISFITNSQYTKTFYWREIPLTATQTKIAFNLNPEEQNSPLLGIDQDGDNQLDQEIQPTSILNQEEAEDITKPTTSFSVTGQTDSQGNYISTTTVTLIAQDNETGSGILKTEYYLNNNPFQTYHQPIVLTQSGQYTISYRSIDRTGNEEEWQTTTLTIISPPKTKTIAQIIKEIKAYYQQGLIKRQSLKRSLIWRLKSIEKQMKKYEKATNPRKKKVFKRIIAFRLNTIIWTLNFCYRRYLILNPAYYQLKNDLNNLINNL